MTDHFMQCCYTRNGGQGIDSGWQVVAASRELPAKIHKDYALLQSANVASQLPVDGQGRALNLFELVGNGSYIFMTRIHYGLTDSLSRQNNMFAHTFLFPLSERETLSDPNRFLTVLDENFKSSPEEAEPIPEVLLRGAAFNLETALEICGLDEKRYIQLIFCVAAQFMGRSKKPLYIRFDGEGIRLRALLYCIYMGIPYFMRRSLFSSTADINHQHTKNLIFSHEVSASDYYLSPDTGENNILTDRLRGRLERLGFVGYFAENWRQPGVENYFAQLETGAAELGDRSGSNELILKIAHLLLKGKPIGTLGEGELSDRLYDALRTEVKGNVAMESYIARLLAGMDTQEYRLSWEGEKCLEEWLEQTNSKCLKEEGERYQVNSLMHMELSEAAGRLAGMTPSFFKLCCERLVKSERGIGILDLYFSNYMAVVQKDWPSLDEAVVRLSGLPVMNMEQTMGRLRQAAWEVYARQLEAAADPCRALDCYVDFMRSLGEDIQTSGVLEKAQKAYWSHFHLASYRREKQDEYRKFRLPGCEGWERAECMEKLLSCVEHNARSGLVKLNRFVGGRYLDLQESERGWLYELLLEDQAMELPEDKEPKRAEWLYLAVYSPKENVIKQTEGCINLIRSKSYECFQMKFVEQMQNIFGGQEEKRLVWCKLGGIYLDEVCREDEKCRVPLDVWLVIGRYLFRNSFSIFDQYNKAAVLSAEPEEVIYGSNLLSCPEWQEQAEEYIRKGGLAGKTVKKWLSCLRKRNHVAKLGLLKRKI